MHTGLLPFLALALATVSSWDGIFQLLSKQWALNRAAFPKLGRGGALPTGETSKKSEEALVDAALVIATQHELLGQILHERNELIAASSAETIKGSLRAEAVQGQEAEDSARESCPAADVARGPEAKGPWTTRPTPSISQEWEPIAWALVAVLRFAGVATIGLAIAVGLLAYSLLRNPARPQSVLPIHSVDANPLVKKPDALPNLAALNGRLHDSLEAQLQQISTPSPPSSPPRVPWKGSPPKQRQPSPLRIQAKPPLSSSRMAAPQPQQQTHAPSAPQSTLGSDAASRATVPPQVLMDQLRQSSDGELLSLRIQVAELIDVCRGLERAAGKRTTDIRQKSTRITDLEDRLSKVSRTLATVCDIEACEATGEDELPQNSVLCTTEADEPLELSPASRGTRPLAFDVVDKVPIDVTTA